MGAEGDREGPAWCRGSGSARGVQLPPTAGGRAEGPQNTGSGQRMLLHLTLFWGTGDTTGKRSPVNASQLLPVPRQG